MKRRIPLWRDRGPRFAERSVYRAAVRPNSVSRNAWAALTPPPPSADNTSFRIWGYPGLAIIFFLAAAGGGIALLINILFYDKPGPD